MKDAFDKREFVFGVAVEDYNFTDREQETQQLRPIQSDIHYINHSA